MVLFLVKMWQSIVTTLTCWYNFDGINEYIDTDDNTSLYSFIQNTDIFSISVWFRLSDYTANSQGTLLGNNSTTTAAKGISLRYENRSSQGSPARIQLNVSRNSAGNYVNRTNSINQVVTDNDWHLLTITSDGVNTVMLMDDVDVISATESHGTLSTGDSSYDLQLGADGTNDIRWLGDLDEISIYDSTLSPTDTTSIYSKGRTLPDLTTITAYNTSCVSHWRMGENDTLYDYLDFNGTNETITVDSLVSSVSSDTQGSISVWVYIDNPLSSGQKDIITFGDDNTNEYLTLRINTTTGKIQFVSVINNSVKINATSTTPLSGQIWYYITLTQDGVEPKIYINGVEDTFTYITAVDKTVWFSDYSNLDVCRIASRRSNSSNGNYFPGDIDKVIVYNKALSQSEVTTIYEYGRKPGLIGIGSEVSQWEMDSYNPTDVIGSNNGTGVNMNTTNELQQWSVYDEVGTNNGLTVNMTETNKICE